MKVDFYASSWKKDECIVTSATGPKVVKAVRSPLLSFVRRHRLWGRLFGRCRPQPDVGWEREGQIWGSRAVANVKAESRLRPTNPQKNDTHRRR